MTPVPKNLSKQQALAWRRAVARGASTVRAGRVAAAGGVAYYEAEAGSVAADNGFIDNPSDANSLDRHTRGVE